MNKIRFTICALLAVCLTVACIGCGDKAVSPDKATPTLTSTRAYGKNTADKAMDGDATTGWVSAGIASELNIPYLQITYDRLIEVSSITLDDSFAAGRTAEVRAYETVSPSLKSAAFKYTSVPEDERTAIGIFADNGVNGWRAKAEPTAEVPQAFYAEFRSAVSADRIVLDNEPVDVVPESFRLYVCADAVPDSDKLNPAYTGWTEVIGSADNSEYTLTKDFDNAISVKSVLYIVYRQSEENACLHGLYLQQKVTVPDTKHYPVDFNIMYSQDGDEYEIIEVRKNDAPIYTYTFEQKTKLKYIRYMPITEYDDNKPSVGEITVR